MPQSHKDHIVHKAFMFFVNYVAKSHYISLPIL